MKPVYIVLLLCFLGIESRGQLTPSTYRQVFNYDVGDTFQYSYMAINYPGQNMGISEVSMVVITSVVHDSNSVSYGTQNSYSRSTTWYGSNGNPNHVVLESGQYTGVMAYNNLDSSVFYHDTSYPYGIDTSTQFPYTDSVYIDLSMNYKKINSHLEGSFSWSYIDTIYGDSIGFIDIGYGFESDNEGADLSLTYYHKANGQRWGNYSFVNIRSSATDIAPAEPQLQIYPNPASNAATININDALSGATAIITDVTGKEISVIKLLNTNTQIVTAEYAPGIYLVRIIKDEQTAMSKLVIK